MSADLTSEIYHSEDAARAHLEAQRWPDGPVCPHCGVVDNATRLKGEKHRPGLLECRACRKQFSVTIGTVFERSHVPLHKWVLAVHLVTSSKKGMSAHQLHRMLKVTYKTAWFMAHRIRAEGEGILVLVAEPDRGRADVNAILPTGRANDGDGPKTQRTWLERDGRRTAMCNRLDCGVQFALAGAGYAAAVFLMGPARPESDRVLAVAEAENDTLLLLWASGAETCLGAVAPVVLKAMRRAGSVLLVWRDDQDATMQDGAVPLVAVLAARQLAEPSPPTHAPLQRTTRLLCAE